MTHFHYICTGVSEWLLFNAK